MPGRSEVSIRTGRPEFDDLYGLVRGFLLNDRLDLVVDGDRIRGYRTPDARSVWIRDHSDMMRGFRYFEPDLTSAVQHFADTQAASGRVFDYVTTFPEKLPSERENWTKYVRVPVEADVEYRLVKAAFLAWQASGDDEWARTLLPCLEKALAYIRNHRWYWDEATGLVKRAYTIDTWDFAYTAGRHDWLQFQITDDTFWGIMHGDNSGYYEAYRLLARLQRRLGDAGRATYWEREAEQVRSTLNRTCWNGRFYTHFVKLTPCSIDGVDEASQLSLSNPMDVNRGVADHGQAASVIQEYRHRGSESAAFAEWFSIDPPFPDGIFGDERLVRGAYCNGGIMPLVGGELARAAFEHGFEAYGADILARYHQLVSARGESYLWYFPDGTPSTVETSTSPDALPTDGWGSSAMLWALVEGLAGVVDQGRCFDAVSIAPRWRAAGIEEAEVHVGYAASGAGVSYNFRARPSAIEMDIEGDARIVACHILLPDRADVRYARVDARERVFSHTTTESSRYADFTFVMPANGRAHVFLQFR
jgi:hypothetical protein